MNWLRHDGIPLALAWTMGMLYITHHYWWLLLVAVIYIILIVLIYYQGAFSNDKVK